MSVHPTLPELLLALRRRINDEVKGHQLKHELTIAQLETISFIGATGSKTMEQIASHLGIKPPSVTSMIEAMHKRGYVKRAKDPHDRRLSYVRLTATMKRQLSSLKRRSERALTAVVSKLSAKEKKEFERLLSKLVSSV